MRTALLLGLLAVVASGQVATDAMRRLEACARKYQDIGSYEASAIAQRPHRGERTVRIHLKFAYAGPGMTPPDLPVPMLPQCIQVGPFEMLDQQNRPAPMSDDVTGPVGGFGFEALAWRVAGAKIAGTESIQSHLCDVVEVQYEGTRRNPGGEPVRYWIEPATNQIWKMQFSEQDPLSKSGEIARWTVVWDSWVENQAPPAWLTGAGAGMLAARQRTELVGRAAPEIAGRMLSGEPFQLSRARGKVVALDFWATYCGPCVEEMASLERLKESFAGKEVEIWSVTEDDPVAVKRWVAERKRTLPTVIAPPESVFKAYRIDGIPQVVLIDRKGAVAQHWNGLTSEKELRQAIETLLAQ